MRESSREREHLLSLAPHLVRPVRFVMPHVRGIRPAWQLRIGFAIYDRIGGRGSLPRTRSLDLADDPAGAPLKPGFGLGFEYSDCVTDDARLVIANAIGASVTLTTASGRKLRNHVAPSGGFMSSSDRRLHFGLGKESEVRSLEIRWPSGRTQTLERVTPDRVLKIEEPS